MSAENVPGLYLGHKQPGSPGSLRSFPSLEAANPAAPCALSPGSPRAAQERESGLGGLCQGRKGRKLAFDLGPHERPAEPGVKGDLGPLSCDTGMGDHLSPPRQQSLTSVE